MERPRVAPARMRKARSGGWPLCGLMTDVLRLSNSVRPNSSRDRPRHPPLAPQKNGKNEATIAEDGNGGILMLWVRSCVTANRRQSMVRIGHRPRLANHQTTCFLMVCHQVVCEKSVCRSHFFLFFLYKPLKPLK